MYKRNEQYFFCPQVYHIPIIHLEALRIKTYFFVLEITHKNKNRKKKKRTNYTVLYTIIYAEVQSQQ